MLGNRLLCVLDRDGNLAGPMPEFARDPVELLRLYRTLVLTRTFDTKAIALQRTGRLGTYASSLGQEAVSVGAAAAICGSVHRVEWELRRERQGRQIKAGRLQPND